MSETQAGKAWVGLRFKLGRRAPVTPGRFITGADGSIVLYLWIKSLHVLSMVAWMAGMLYLPRLFVYHAAAGFGTPQADTFKVMERRLLRAIMNPAMIVVWLTGLYLAWDGGWYHFGWLHTKILLVLVMTGCHGFLSASRKRFEADANVRSGGFFRVVNEVPTVLLIGIVILVIVKPF